VSNTVISTSVIRTYSASTNNTWNEARASLVPPPGTTNALIQMVVSSLNATIYVDRFRFEGSGSIPVYTLTVVRSGTGNGRITSTPPGIDCGIDCIEGYIANTSVTLTVAADPGSTFIGWNGGGCSGTNECIVGLTADTSVSANFQLQDVTPPSVSWIAPVADYQVYDVANETIRLEVSATDDFGVSEVVFYRWDFVNLVNVELGRASSAPYAINFDTSSLLPAENEINALAFDAAGNLSSSTIWLNYISSDVIFANSFEDDDCFTSQWSACVDGAGDLVFDYPAVVLKNNASMIITIDDNGAVHVTSDHPNAEMRYRARFFFDPNSITMTSGNAHYIFYGYSGASKVVLQIEFRKYSSNYQVRGAALTDGSNWKNTSWFTITDAPHVIEFDWRAATGVGANNGGLTLWIDEVQKVNLGSIDNDTLRIDRVRLGAVTGIDTGTRGKYYFDAFESRRETYIGR
jgi:hypothetical protein